MCEVLKLDPSTTKRIVFREITKPAIEKAIDNPRTVDINLVNAQQARRVLDRLVGFELSSLLWRKVKNKLSAGRVQSVAVKLIVEKEREIQSFVPNSFFKIVAYFNGKDLNGNPVRFKAEFPKRFADEKSALDYINDSNGAQFSVGNIQVKPAQRKPTAPFTTSTLQQEASRKLGFGVKRTMSVAQRLYERGFISYMRTDSVALSQTALESIEKEILSRYGDDYVEIRHYKNKNSGAQEAHEAIRPTNFERNVIEADDMDMQRLYSLIWKRAVASQMSNAKIERTTMDINVSTRTSEPLVSKGEVITFDGFLKLYVEGKDEKEEEQTNQLPKLNEGDQVHLDSMEGVERFTRPPARYTEASLVKKLEELGIGRPSTYAPTISKIMEAERGYVVKESREGVERSFRHINLKDGQVQQTNRIENSGVVKNRLFATDLGMVVVDFLDKHFDNIMDYKFTSKIEEEFDEIADGKGDWTDMLDEFYGPFHQNVVKTMDTAERATGERILGKDPESGRTLLVRMTRFGRPVVQIGAPDELLEGETPKYANLRPGMSLETVSAEDVLPLFQLPRDLGEYKGEAMIVAEGRFGPYVKFGDKFVSIPRGEDPFEITKERAQELVDQKLKEDEPIGYYKELPMTKGKGRFGPFIKWNGMFCNVSKKYDFDNLSTDEALEIVKIKEEKEANRYIHQWPEEKIAVENGRWGPFIRFNKKSVKLPKIDGQRQTQEQAKELTLEQVKAIIEEELPGSFKEKKPKKKAPAKKKATAKKK